MTQENDNDDINIDDRILGILKNTLLIRRKDLIGKLNKEKASKLVKRDKLNKRSKDGLSLITINRHLNYLKQIKEIIVLKQPEYEKYGIFDKDKRATYITLAKNSDIIKHNDIVIKALKSNNPIIKRNSLTEIESMESINLIPNQLIELSNLLLKEDFESCQSIIRIILHNFDNLNFPSDLKKFQDNLIQYYERQELKIERNTKAHIIYMLGILNNEIIIKWLKEDVQNKGGYLKFREEKLIEDGYYCWSIARLIERHKTELFEFQNSLPTRELSTNVFRIRDQARINLQTYENNIKKFKQKLVDVKK